MWKNLTYWIILVILLVSCSSPTTSEVLKNAEDSFLSSMKGEKKSPNINEEKVSFYKPFTYSIISNNDNNYVLENDNRKVIIFYNPLSDNQIEMFREVEKDTENSVVISEYDNKAILHIDDVSKEGYGFDYQVIVASKKVKVTVLTDKANLEEDVKNVSLIANSFDYSP